MYTFRGHSKLTAPAPPLTWPAPPISVEHPHWQNADSATTVDPEAQKPGMYLHVHPFLCGVPRVKKTLI